MAHGDGYLFPSVTQVLGAVLRKPQLENWFKYNSAQFCNEESKRGKEIGTETHELIQRCIDGEEMALDTEYADEIKNTINSFFKFKKENPEYKLKRSEVILNIKKYGYSGRLDVIGERNEKKFIGDWKTGKSKDGELKFYPEMIYQVAAYTVGYNLQFKKQIKNAVIILLDKTAVNYGIQEVDEAEMQDAFKNVFLPCVKIYNYQRRKK